MTATLRDVAALLRLRAQILDVLSDLPPADRAFVVAGVLSDLAPPVTLDCGCAPGQTAPSPYVATSRAPAPPARAPAPGRKLAPRGSWPRRVFDALRKGALSLDGIAIAANVTNAERPTLSATLGRLCAAKTVIRGDGGAYRLADPGAAAPPDDAPEDEHPAEGES